MARPAFSLTDEEGRALVAALTNLNACIPLNPRDHRAFVRAFIAAVHEVTGHTYSPTIYRRILGAYAPDRRPSSATLALEKQRFVEQLARGRAPSPEKAAARPDYADFREELREALAAGLATQGNPAESYLAAQCSFLQQRLTQSEQQLVEAKVGVAALDAQRAALLQQAALDQQQIDALRASTATLTQEIGRLSQAVDDARQFALLAIDEARGETRAWKERCAALEATIKEQVAITETFRRLAYRQGAEVPFSLQKPERT